MSDVGDILRVILFFHFHAVQFVEGEGDHHKACFFVPGGLFGTVGLAGVHQFVEIPVNSLVVDEMELVRSTETSHSQYEIAGSFGGEKDCCCIIRSSNKSPSEFKNAHAERMPSFNSPVDFFSSKFLFSSCEMSFSRDSLVSMGPPSLYELEALCSMETHIKQNALLLKKEKYVGQ